MEFRWQIPDAQTSPMKHKMRRGDEPIPAGLRDNLRGPRGIFLGILSGLALWAFLLVTFWRL